MVPSPDKSKAERPYHHGNLRAALLEAAIEAIEEHGVAELKLRELARRVGVSHGAPANHFKDRQDLLVAVALQGFERLREYHEAVLAREHASAADALNALGVAYVEFAVNNPAHFEVMFQRGLLASPELLEAGARCFEVLLGAVHGVQRNVPGQGAGEAADNCVDAGLVALGCWATVHGLATLHCQGLLPAGVADVPKLADQVIVAMTRLATEQGRG